MNPGTRARHDKALTALRDEYPSLFIASESDWTKLKARYWAKLKVFGIDAILVAIDRAPEEYPGRFPDAGQLMRLCKVAQLEAEAEQREVDEAEARRRAEQAERDRVLDRRQFVIPDRREDQDRWVDAGETHCERLARRIEVESKRRNTDPSRKTPPEVFEILKGELIKAFEADSNEADQRRAQTRNQYRRRHI